MKVFTFFYNRYDNATTSKALNENGITHNVLVHNLDDLKKFIKGGTIQGKVTVTNNGKGLAYQRNAALDMIETGEWAVFMSDDFQKIKAYPKEFIFSKTQNIAITQQNQNNYRLKNEINLREMFNWFPKLIELAEKNNIHLIGFGLHDNPMNLRKKFNTRGLADGRFWLVKKSHYKFDLNAQMIDDFAWTAENLVRHKNVLVLNWCVPYFERYTAGGYGSMTERKALRIKECAYLANRFDPLIKIAEKPGWENGTHIRIYGVDSNIEKVRHKIGLI